ncbi:MAG: helix-turn-helix domain-containing protein [Treponema sp.]|jgi:transcriptional regulator with XRE-family HTH domain|nr:helix-turn-helix domain-containing protein [Treponema sp.]
MTDFSQRLHEAIAYVGLLQKDVALKAGIKKRALDMYFDSRKSMPPADAAARLADALGVSVEYLVTGKTKPAVLRPVGLFEVLRCYQRFAGFIR